MPASLTIDPLPPRQPVLWREWAALLVAITLGVGIWHVDVAASRAVNTSIDNRHIGYLNRAAVCDFIREFGGVEPRACNDPAIQPYRDQRIIPGEGERHNTTNLLCRLLTIVAPTAPKAAQCTGTR